MRNGKFFSMTAYAVILWTICSAAMPAPAQAQEVPDAKKRAAGILADAAAATGGETLKKVESLSFTSAGDVNTPMGTIAVESKSQLSYPDRARFETSLQMGTFSQGFDGKVAWVSSAQGTFDLPGDLSGEYVRGIDLTGGIGLYKKVFAGKAEAEFTGEKEFAGQKTLLVEWSGPTGKVKLYFDAATKLLVGAKYRAITMQGEFEEERRWSDFRELEGVKFPFHWVTYRDGGLYSDVTVKDAKLNTKMEASTFAKPQ
jgi:outer membrane lipoprotein-sorting protein